MTAPPRATPLHVILLDRPTVEQINRVHELLKRHTTGWWHHFENAWIVAGDRTAAQWRTLIAPALDRGPTSALVLRLPDDGDQRHDWSYFGVDTAQRAAWLEQNLSAIAGK
jgi:hypothetical protein